MGRHSCAAWIAVASAFVLGPSAATAGPVTWGYRVSTYGDGVEPSRVLAEAYGVTDREVMLEGLMQRPTSLTPVELPDPARHLWDTYVWTDVVSREVMFLHEHTQHRSFTAAVWAVDREWEKTADGRGWTYLGESDRLFDIEKDVYTADPWFELVVSGEGDLVLSVTPDAPTYDQPEPGTAVLAGVGLGAAALLRLRRRASKGAPHPQVAPGGASTSAPLGAGRVAGRPGGSPFPG